MKSYVYILMFAFNCTYCKLYTAAENVALHK